MCIVPSEWENVTPLYFRLRLEGMRNEAQQKYRADMDRTRMLASILLSPHMKKGAKADPKKIWPLPWDEVQKIDTVDLVNFVSKNKDLYDKLRL